MIIGRYDYDGGAEGISFDTTVGFRLLPVNICTSCGVFADYTLFCGVKCKIAPGLLLRKRRHFQREDDLDLP